MNNTSKTLIGIIVVLLIGWGIYAMTHQLSTKTKSQLAGYTPGSSISGSTGLSLTYQTNQNGPTSTPTIDPNGGFIQNGLADIVTSGTFSENAGQVVTNGIYPNTLNFNGKTITGSSYAASTTLFAVQNPYGATSTLQYGEIYGQGATSSISLMVGTSSVPWGVSYGLPGVTNTISPTVINATVATSSGIFAAQGITVGSTAGFQSAGSGSFTEIIVGPYDYVVGYATTTYAKTPDTNPSQTITGAQSTLAGNYSFEWYR